MKKTLILVTLILLSILPFTYAANDFAYNRLYDGSQPIDGFNYSINVNHSIFTDSWITPSLGLLDDVSTTQFNNIAGTLTLDATHFDLRWCQLTGCDMSGDINMQGNSLLNVLNINGTGDIMMTRSTPGVSLINAMSTNPIGVSVIRADSDSGSFASLVSIGSQFPGANLSANDSGIIAGGGRLIFVNNGLEDIAFAHVTGGGSNFSNASFSFRLDSTGNAFLAGDLFLEDEEKSIRTVTIDGGSAIVLDSNDSIVSGGFPVIEVARTAQGERVVTRWAQNGRNNSFSGFMNSIGPVPKSWINFSGETDEEGISFLFNRSDYPNYCDYLQTNLSLIPEGCKYFADTSGRLVPLLFAGDLEVHRTATIHEGLTVFDNFEFIGRNGNDAEFLFNGDEGGSLHIRDNRDILANITDFDTVVCNFDDATLCELYSESIAPEIGRDWASVQEPECHQDRCANAKGGNLKIMSVDSVTFGGTDINFSFWLTTVISGADSFYIISDDHQGNVSTIFTEIATVTDQSYVVNLPFVFWNKPNVTTSFYLDGQNAIREAWIDDISVQATLSPSVEINESYEGGNMIIGEDRGNDSCGFDVNQYIPNGSLSPEWRMNISCDNINLVGNITQTDVTEVEINVTDNVTANNFIAREHYYGNGSFLTDITSTLEETLIEGDNANGQSIYGLSNLNVTNYTTTVGMTVDGGNGPADLLIIADKDNVNENDVATLSLDQDGSLITGYLGFLSTNDLVLDHTGVGGAWGLGFARNGVIQLGTDGDGNTYATGNVTAPYFIGDGSQLTGITHTENQTLEEVLIEGNNGQGQNITNVSRVTVNPNSSPVILGTPVTGTFGDGVTDTIIPGVLVLDRSSSGGMFYNTILEVGYDAETSPLDTEWNTEFMGSSGWSDFNDITRRDYLPLAEAFDFSIGNNIVGDEMVMHVISTDQYFKIDVTSWISGATTGKWTYTRTELTPIVIKSVLDIDSSSGSISINNSPLFEFTPNDITPIVPFVSLQILDLFEIANILVTETFVLSSTEQVPLLVETNYSGDAQAIFRNLKDEDPSGMKLIIQDQTQEDGMEIFVPSTSDESSNHFGIENRNAVIIRPRSNYYSRTLILTNGYYGGVIAGVDNAYINFSQDEFTGLNGKVEIPAGLLSVAENVSVGGDLNVSGLYYGNGSQLSGITQLWENISSVATYYGNVNITDNLSVIGDIDVGAGRFNDDVLIQNDGMEIVVSSATVFSLESFEEKFRVVEDIVPVPIPADTSESDGYIVEFTSGVLIGQQFNILGVQASSQDLIEISDRTGLQVGDTLKILAPAVANLEVEGALTAGSYIGDGTTLTGLVPYNGATEDVFLGNNRLSTSDTIFVGPSGLTSGPRVNLNSGEFFFADTIIFGASRLASFKINGTTMNLIDSGGSETVDTFNIGMDLKQQDNSKHFFGTADDSSIYYDDTNMIINPKEVGSGQLKVLGDLNITESLHVTDDITTDIYKFGNGAWIGYNATCQMIFYNSTGGVMSTQGCS